MVSDKDVKELKKMINKSKKSKDEGITTKILKARFSAKQITKSSKLVVSVPDYKAPSILNDPNRFFTGEFNKEKRSLFLS